MEFAEPVLDNRREYYDSTMGRHTMYLVLSIIFSCLAAFFYVPDFLDIPFGVMTARLLFGQLGFVIAVLAGLATFSHSVEKEGIWPWNRCRMPSHEAHPAKRD